MVKSYKIRMENIGVKIDEVERAFYLNTRKSKISHQVRSNMYGAAYFEVQDFDEIGSDKVADLMEQIVRMLGGNTVKAEVYGLR